LRSLTFAAASIIEIAAVGGLVAYVIAAGDNAWSYAAPFVCAVVVFVFSEERGLVSRLLSTAPFTAAGRISYSIYINHLLVISSAIAVFGALSQQTGARLVSLAADGEMVLGTNQLEGAVIVAAMLATLITVSMLTYRCIEMPLYAMAKRRAARQAGSGADTPLSVARTHL
jgi:peptidoglycan/LPS O-acetylase OafA/YrhL